MKKRYVLKNKRRFMISIAVAVSILGSVLLASATRPQGYSQAQPDEIVVKSGDTLWDIAVDAYGGNSDIRRMVALVQKTNGMDSPEIYPGQVLLIPSE
ncbi:MAG: LysM peptidoglycan-binding domain-containing protein [Clostridia bacterium]|nr:LysM peptidoglycan-binding domain-containing protein [Clostridia bacterium]